MLREIQEIQGLATKYSKAELGRMVQMGLLDPQKAMMAGMMIQRIEQQNAQPPQTTVAQDVLGLPAVANQQPQPQMSAQMPQAGAGIEALPAGDVGNYAGGGIVAFDEGGEVPGYAGGDGSWVIDPAVQRQRDMQWRLPILKQELQEAQQRGDAASVAALQREIRRMVPAPSADAGVGSLIPSAQAAEVTSKLYSPFGLSTEQEMLARRQEGVGFKAPATGTAALMQQQVYDEYGINPGVVSPAQAAAAKQSAENAAKRAEAKRQLDALQQQYMYGRPDPNTQARIDALKQEVNAMSAPVPVAKTPATGVASVAPGATGPSEGWRNAAGAEGEEPTGGTAALPPIARPTVDTRTFEEKVAAATPKVGELPITKVPTDEEITARRESAEKRAGYDPDVFNNMISGIQEKKGSLANEKDRALGEAIMMAGFKLMGARQGQEFQALSEGAQEGLKTFQSQMKDVKALQEKYDERIETLRTADMQAKKSNAATDIARRDKLEEQARNDQVKLFEAKNAAAAAGVQAAASMSNADKALAGHIYSAELQNQASKEYTAALKAQGLEIQKAKILTDAMADFMKNNATAYMGKSDQLIKDATAYANSIGMQLGILPKGANMAPAPAPTPDLYKNKYGITPTR